MLKDKHEAVLGGEVHDVEQLYDVRMADLLEDADLANAVRRNAVFRGVDLDLLQGNHFVAERLERLVDHSVGALSDLLQQLVVADTDRFFLHS